MREPRGILLVVLGIFCSLAFTGCWQRPTLKVGPPESELDSLVDKGLPEDQASGQEAVPLTDRVTIVTGEPAIQSKSEPNDPATQDDTGAVAVKYEL